MKYNYRNLSRIERIKLMEQYLDEVKFMMDNLDQSEIVNQTYHLFRQELMEKSDILMDYYFHGTWLEDYEADERGELPKDLKRGVLAQDTLYNLYIKLKVIAD